MPGRVPFGCGLFACILSACALWGCADPRDRLEGTETRVLVVGRASDPVSRRIALRYAELRGVRASHVVFLRLPRSEEVTRTTFERAIVGPLLDWWQLQPRDERPDYVVLVKGVPHKIYGDGGRLGTRASVDSELCDLPSYARGATPAHEGRRINPYSPRRDGSFPRFTREEYGICLVTRLDGYREDDALGLLERAMEAERRAALAGSTDPADSTSRADRHDHDAGVVSSGARVLFDASGADGTGNGWLRSAAEAVAASRVDVGGLPVSVDLDTMPDFVTGRDSLLGYASWGSNDPRYVRDLRFTWVPGGLATTFVSSSARTFREPPPQWTPGPANREAHEFGGSTQSLIADLVRAGATGASGNAYEPYLDACARPQILFPAYFAGRTLAESFYLALPYLSWQTVVLGDPLCAPYAPRAAPATREVARERAGLR